MREPSGVEMRNYPLTGRSPSGHLSVAYVEGTVMPYGYGKA